MPKRLLAIIGWAISFITIAVVDVMIQISPNDAAHNVSEWFRFFGRNPPKWLDSPNASKILHVSAITLTITIVIALLWVLLGGRLKKVFTKNSLEKLLGKPAINDLVYAEFGEKTSENRSRWTNLSLDGIALSEVAKRLLRLVNRHNLKIAIDPAPGSRKKLRLKFLNGTCAEINEGKRLSLKSAEICPPFSLPAFIMGKTWTIGNPIEKRLWFVQEHRPGQRRAMNVDIAFMAEFTNLQDFQLMIKDYVIYEILNGQLRPAEIIHVGPPNSGKMYLGDLNKTVRGIKSRTFDSAIQDKSIGPRETIRGWVFIKHWPNGEYFLEVRDHMGIVYGERFSPTIRENFSVGVGDSFPAQPVLLELGSV
jgi:hypothetical protein